MIKILARIGRFYSVLIITLIAAAASFSVTAAAAYVLNNQFDFSIDTPVALAFGACVPFAVVPPITWMIIGLTLRIYHTEEEMRKIASYDSLTGLLSRHAFFESAGNYVSLAERENTGFSAMVVDLDHFKSINDQHGHPAGDAVLELFAAVVNSVARRSDIIGRLGGEEFAMLLPNTGSEEALEFSNRLHHAIDQAVLKYRDSIIRYSASIGLATSAQGENVGIDELLARADLALYQAKRDGRGRTATFNPGNTRSNAG